MYHCLRYSQHTLSDSVTPSRLSLKKLMERIYSSCSYTDQGFATGGEVKFFCLFTGPGGVLGAFDFAASPLTTWFKLCASTVAQWLLAMGQLGDEPSTDNLALRNHEALIEIWRDTAARSDWPEGDKAVDQVPNLGQRCESKRKAETDTGTSGQKRSKSNTGIAIPRTVNSLQRIDE